MRGQKQVLSTVEILTYLHAQMHWLILIAAYFQAFLGGSTFWGQSYFTKGQNENAFFSKNNLMVYKDAASKSVTFLHKIII